MKWWQVTGIEDTQPYPRRIGARAGWALPLVNWAALLWCSAASALIGFLAGVLWEVSR